MISNDKLLYCMANRKLKPITADVFLTNYCNNKCGYCAYGRWEELKTEPSWMWFEDFKEYLFTMLNMGVKGIILTGGGEPTINPDFYKIAHYMEHIGVAYGVNTNFNDYKVYFEPTFLKISADAGNKEAYLRKRGVDGFAKMVENVRRYRKEQNERNGSTQLVVQCLATDLKDTIDFIDFWLNEDVDKVVVRPMESTQGKYYKDKENERVKDDILHYLDTVKDERLVTNFKFNLLDTHFCDCVANAAQLAINEKGEVMYCCHKPYEIVGHILDHDILEQKAAYRTNIAMCDVPCRLAAPNKVMETLEDKPKDWMFI